MKKKQTEKKIDDRNDHNIIFLPAMCNINFSWKNPCNEWYSNEFDCLLNRNFNMNDMNFDLKSSFFFSFFHHILNRILQQQYDMSYRAVSTNNNEKNFSGRFFFVII